ncbi:MAG: TonB-dependent receptor [Bacillota bacterium]
MLFRSLVLLLVLVISSVKAQAILNGTVSEKDDGGNLRPLFSASIQWLGTGSGTTADENGNFSILLNTHSDKLIISMIGYRTDTVTVISQQNINVILISEAHSLKDVVVTGKAQSLVNDYLHVENKSVITEQELCKAACCNLSESFETNPSVDVSFTDAITGAKQIEMLGLSGIYTQTTMENLPYIRGLMSTTGLTFIPGTWVKAINMSKGIGSVANGYESITGQIDIDIQKPVAEDSERMLLNIYGDYDRRLEGNLNYRFNAGKNVSAITLLHASSRNHALDGNDDMFTDMPDFSIYNFMQRWNIDFQNGWISQIGFQYLNDKKRGGTIEHKESSSELNMLPENYRYSIDNSQYNIYVKLGYIFPEDESRSFGLQWSFNGFSNKSDFGKRSYAGDEKTGYLNFIYQSDLGSEVHRYRTGISFLYDSFNERFLSGRYIRTERVPGIFLEYTFSHDETFSLVLGGRADYHNFYGTMLTPRVHVRYSPKENWVFRAAAGRGFRTSNIFTEYSSVLASARSVEISQAADFGYGLQQERAWNFGFNATHYFLFDYREGSIQLDLYRTVFEQATIADLDSDPQKIRFSSLPHGSYSNSIQLQLNFAPFERFDLRAAYRYMDVRQNINGKMTSRPLSSMNRALLNLAYATEKENDEDAQMQYDMTVQWFGTKRIPSTSSNPVDLRVPDKSPDFTVINTQITRVFNSGVSVYLGIENLLGFRQNELIIDPLNPNGKYFDASLIWGPVNGRMAYAGLRLRL